jgi:hypothetical protein
MQKLLMLGADVKRDGLLLPAAQSLSRHGKSAMIRVFEARTGAGRHLTICLALGNHHHVAEGTAASPGGTLQN